MFVSNKEESKVSTGSIYKTNYAVTIFTNKFSNDFNISSNEYFLILDSELSQDYANIFYKNKIGWLNKGTIRFYCYCLDK